MMELSLIVDIATVAMILTAWINLRQLMRRGGSRKWTSTKGAWLHRKK